MDKIIKDKRGFTLVEIIVSLAIFSVVIAVAGIIFLSSSNISSRHARYNTAEQIGEAALSFVSEELAVSTGLSEKLSANVALTDKGFKIQDGRLYWKNASEDFADLYGTDFYDGYHLEIRLENISLPTLDVAVSVSSEDGTIGYQSKRTIRLLNYPYYQSQFTVPTTTINASSAIVIYQ